MNANLIQIKVKHAKTLNYNCLDKKKKNVWVPVGSLWKKKFIHYFFWGWP